MPRQNPQRTVPFETHVAANLARERERTGLTYERLAERMTERGCPIQPSALHKIEKGDPPRRITVNELMIMADALGVKAFDLVDNPDRSLPTEIWRAVHDVEECVLHIVTNQLQIADFEAAIERIVAEVAAFIGDDSHLRATLRRHLAEDWEQWPEFRKHFQPALRPPKRAGA